MPFADRPHRRYDPLGDRWVLVSPHRTQRPWQGAEEAVPVENRPRYDPNCYLCPGNARAGGHKNPDYGGTYVFRNDFAALLPSEGAALETDSIGLFRAEPAFGECRVICYSPRHDLSLGELGEREITRVVDVWAEQIEDLGKTYPWVQLFENRGAAMGASNPHPHGQVWTTDHLPDVAATECRTQAHYFSANGRPLLMAVAEEELKARERVVSSSDHWVLLVPYWAVWPFEYLLLPRRPVQRLPDLTSEERRSLATILKDGLGRYDRLFDTPFPYSMGWHGAPNDGRDHPEWTLHAHFYPPLLRSAAVRKFMVGFEMLAEAQRDLTPEAAAERLRQKP